MLGKTGAEPRTTDAAGRWLNGLSAARQVLQNRRQEAEKVANESAVQGADSGAIFTQLERALQSPYGPHQAARSTPARGHPPGEKVTWDCDSWGVRWVGRLLINY